MFSRCFYSGPAAYHNTLELPQRPFGQGRRLVLDLGRFRFVADVHLNGKPLGILRAPPFRLDITGAARPGRNNLKIALANTWSNRLTGDANSAGPRTFTNTNAA